MTDRQRTHSEYLVSLASEQFDPKDAGQKARRRAMAGKRRLAAALGTSVEAIPGAARQAYLLQFARELGEAVKDRFRLRYGLKFDHPAGGQTYVERLPNDALASLRREQQVRACVPFWPDLKLHPALAAARRVEIGLLTGDDVAGVRSISQVLGVSILRVDSDSVAESGVSLLGEVSENADLLALAALDDVAWISPIGEIGIKNLRAAAVVQGGTGSGHPLWDRGLHGEGMIIGVTDVGDIDLDSSFLSDASRASPHPAHRKVVQNRRAGGSFNSALNRLLPHGDPSHPTAVVGCAVGDEEGNSGGHHERGGAWAARAAYSDILRIWGQQTSSLSAEFQAAADAGAFVHSCSFSLDSSPTAPAYSNSAKAVDDFLWSREDQLCVVAAPNPGGTFESGLVVAKNPVVVGGVHSPEWHGPGPRPAEADQDVRRPDPLPVTADGRRKPDLLAVAEVWTSTLSRRGADRDPIAVAPADGNSYATAHVAAAAALVRQYFEEGWYPGGKKQPENGLRPTGALLKAVLLNATVPLAGVLHYPSARDGWGRLELDKTLHFDGDKLRLTVHDRRHRFGLKHGEHSIFRLRVPDNAKRVKVTLVFNDPKPKAAWPTNPGVNPVVNNLELEVLEPLEPLRYRWLPRMKGYIGNDFNGLVSRERDFLTNVPRNHAELKNNVRQVVVHAPVAGPWRMRVKALHVDGDTPVQRGERHPRQGYAVVACVELD
jgi:hypothetical protein